VSEKDARALSTRKDEADKIPSVALEIVDEHPKVARL
jgi:hypothetical protein